MRQSAWTLMAAALLLLCLASFVWAMLRFFSRPAGTSTGAKLIGFFGFVFGVLHFAAILRSPNQSSLQGLTAVGLYVVALALFWWAIRTNLGRPLSAVFSPDVPEHLIQEGPYQFIRHPFYCSYLLTWMGGVLATQQLLLLATAAVMFVIYLRAARMEEEKFGSSLLGPSYQMYQARTGLFFPNPIKLMAPRSVR